MEEMNTHYGGYIYYILYIPFFYVYIYICFLDVYSSYSLSYKFDTV